MTGRGCSFTAVIISLTVIHFTRLPSLSCASSEEVVTRKAITDKMQFFSIRFKAVQI
jgi:hypothetical protein